MKIIPFLLVLNICGGVPYIKSKNKVKQIRKIIKYSEKKGLDSYEMLAIALTESSFNPKAVSNKGAIGLFQVMCKYWAKPLGYKSVDKCKSDLFNPEKNIAAGAHVLTTYRSGYKQCKGSLAYRCYFAGPFWYRRGPKLMKKIAAYEKKVLENKDALLYYHKDFIEKVRNEYRIKG
jgi:soluble lytic murein transglycosylase-like protein